MRTAFLVPMLAAIAGAQVKFPAAYAPTNDIVLDNLVPVKMRDGVTLYADIYRPAKPGRHPVIVSRTPYSTERYPSAYDAALYFSRRGYAYVYQDVRGRHESDGKWEPFRNDIEDGYDTVEWAATQAWSNGKVGMEGGSYLGHVQWRAAMAKPPHLVCMVPRVASTSLYHNWITLNGGWRLSFNFGWGPVRQESRIMQNTGPHTIANGPEAISYANLLQHLPLNNMQELAGRHAQFYRDWLAHPDYDDYWKKINVEEMFDQIGIPVYTMGGWFDIFSAGTLNGYAGMAAKGKTDVARRQSRLLIGPWGHGSSRKFGEMDYGEHAHVDENAAQLRFFDYWLKGKDDGISKEPPVTLYVMGKNVWRQEKEYPLARTQYRKLFLSGNGALGWDAPAGVGKPDTYRYDPADPVPSTGGNNCCGTPTPAGPMDQRKLDSRKDILRYLTAPLDRDIEVTGPVKVVLHASSDCTDTDFIAKLIDVSPDGRAIPVAEGIVRARYRESLSRPRLLEPGKVYPFEINLVGTSNAFLRGHRIRVDLTSSHFPQFDRNPNTGDPFGSSAKTKVATQSIYHDAARASHILLPVIP
ncbi:MAG: CocE/NonD family hydrolase [Acidobacteria bacterium]|nr:CocE/NonD family hydrolase [Acidobacteriota bacterium]